MISISRQRTLVSGMVVALPRRMVKSLFRVQRDFDSRVFVDCNLKDSRRNSVTGMRRFLSLPFVRALYLCAPLALGCTEISTDPATPQSLLRAPTDVQSSFESDLRGAVPGAYLVALRNDGSDVAVRADELLRGTGAVRGRVWTRAIRGFSVRNLSPERAAALARDSRVRRIEPDRIGFVSTYRQLVMEYGTYIGASQWALDRIDHYGSAQFDGQFNYTHTGSGVHIYIVDSGLRGTHQEYSGRLSSSSCHMILGCSPTIDGRDHGTGMASFAAGTKYGVAPGATLHSVRVAHDDGAIWCTDVVDAINWILENAQHPAVVNNSWEMYPGCFGVRDAMYALVSANMVVVKSAGNNNVDAYDDRANRTPGILVVGGTTTSDQRALYSGSGGSNWGSTVTLMAPGAQARAAAAGSDTLSAHYWGTSGAAALVSGTAALIRQAYPTMTAGGVRSILRLGSSPVTISNGNGVANRVLYAAVPALPPAAVLTSSISGEQAVQPNSQYTYTAVVGGTSPQAPYSYEWFADGEPVGISSSVSLSFAPSSITGLFLRITDSNGVLAESDGSFFVTASSGQCPPEDPNCHESRLVGTKAGIAAPNPKNTKKKTQSMYKQ
jgi:aqualysin 1